jgi:hypothetical protein
VLEIYQIFKIPKMSKFSTFQNFKNFQNYKKSLELESFHSKILKNSNFQNVGNLKF